MSHSCRWASCRCAATDPSRRCGSGIELRLRKLFRRGNRWSGILCKRGALADVFGAAQTGVPGGAERSIDFHIILSHPADAEALLEHAPAFATTEHADALDRLRRLL